MEIQIKQEIIVKDECHLSINYDTNNIKREDSPVEATDEDYYQVYKCEEVKIEEFKVDEAPLERDRPVPLQSVDDNQVMWCFSYRSIQFSAYRQMSTCRR